MDQQTLGNVLFLSSLAGLSIGCAAGSEGEGPRPGPFVTGVGDDGGAGDPWTDPIETTGASGTSSMPEDDDGESGWPNEGETGVVSSDTGEPPPEDDGEPMSGSSSGGMPSGGEETGDDGGDTTGDDSPVGGDPCPALAQLYADCVPEYTYEAESQLCNQARDNAAAVSAACGIAHTEYLTCLSTLDCATLLAPGLACVAQAAATDLVCLL